MFVCCSLGGGPQSGGRKVAFKCKPHTGEFDRAALCTTRITIISQLGRDMVSWWWHRQPRWNTLATSRRNIHIQTTNCHLLLTPAVLRRESSYCKSGGNIQIWTWNTAVMILRHQSFKLNVHKHNIIGSTQLISTTQWGGKRCVWTQNTEGAKLISRSVNMETWHSWFGFWTRAAKANCTNYNQ